MTRVPALSSIPDITAARLNIREKTRQRVNIHNIRAAGAAR
jgi:hypothetical protein